MLQVTQQLSKVSAYLSSVSPTLSDSKVASVALTALGLVASAFSYFTLPHVISYTLGGLSLLALAATTALFVKMNQQEAAKAKAQEEEKKAMEAAAAKAAEANMAPVKEELSLLWRVLGYSAETKPTAATLETAKAALVAGGAAAKTKA